MRRILQDKAGNVDQAHFSLDFAAHASRTTSAHVAAWRAEQVAVAYKWSEYASDQGLLCNLAYID